MKEVKDLLEACQLLVDKHNREIERLKGSTYTHHWGDSFIRNIEKKMEALRLKLYVFRK